MLLSVHCVSVYRVGSPHQGEQLLGFVEFTCSIIESKPMSTVQETVFWFLEINIFKDDAADIVNKNIDEHQAHFQQPEMKK